MTVEEDFRMQEKQRIRYIDLVKGIGIIAVIIGHMNLWKLNKIIYSFHMPLFFLLAGAFIPQKYSNKQYAIKKAKQLLVPYVFTCVVLVLLAYLRSLLKGDFDIFNIAFKWIVASIYASGNLEPYRISRIGAIWFLWAMFISCIFVKWISGKRYAAVMIVLVVIVGYLTTGLLWLPFSVQAAMVASGYVYIGYISKQKQVLERQFKLPTQIFMITIWIFDILLDQINMSKNQYKYSLFSFVLPLNAVYLVLMFCKFVDKKNIFPIILKTLSFYGKNTLVILCFHLIELEMFPWGYLKNVLTESGVTKWIIPVVNFVIKMLVATLAVLMSRKIEFLRKIFSVQ